VTGYVVDDLALIAGLAGHGSEHQRRELSRLLHCAIDGGPALEVPALCLTAAATARPAIAEHLADMIAAAPSGSIAVGGFTRTAHLDALIVLQPRLGWPATQAAAHALGRGVPILTVDQDRYTGIGLDC
jgi:hypothetical protein